MIVIDLISASLAVISIIVGLVKGLIRQVGAIASVVIAFVLSNKFYIDLAIFLKKHISLNQTLLYILSFLLLFIIIFFLLYLIVIILGKVSDSTFFSTIDKIAGVLFSLGLAVLTVGAIVYGLTLLPFKDDFINSLKTTYTYRIFISIVTSDIIKHAHK